MADYSRILSDRLGEIAQRDARRQRDLHDVELVRPAVPVGPSNPTLRPVEKVPFDVWFLILGGLEYSDALAFSRTCRAFHSLAPSEALVSAEQRQRFYLKVEKFPRNEGLLVCFSCNKLRPRNRFSLRQSTKRRGKHSLSPDEAIKRHCWDCAANPRLYLENQPFRKDGHLWYLCHQCGIFKHESQRCLKEDAHEDSDGSAAGDRRARSSRRTICTPAWPAIVPSVLESRLPAALQGKIVDHLGYRDRISLAATNRHFRHFVRPLGAPLADRVAVVKRAANWTGGAPSAGPWACMICFRARSEISFPEMEESQTKWWRRRCRACCEFVYKDLKKGAIGLPRGWHPLEECWHCRELKEVDGRCGSCNDEGPAWDRRRELQAQRREHKKLGGMADEDISLPLHVMMDGNALGNVPVDVEPDQSQVSDQSDGKAATQNEGQGREVVQDSNETKRLIEEKLPEEHIGGVVAVLAGRGQSSSSHIYHRIRRFLPNGHPLRRHHSPRISWRAISERLKKALLAR